MKLKTSAGTRTGQATPVYGRWVSLALELVLCSGCAATPTPTSHDGPATTELKRLVATNPQVKRLLIGSIEKAKRVNPDRLTNPVQSLEEYYDFIAWAERAIPGSLIRLKPNATLYQRIDQSLAYLYFLVDQPLPELEGRGYFNNSLQYLEPYNSWLKTFVTSWGAFLNTPESWNEEYLRLAQADSVFGLNRGWYEDPSRWRTFNEFFARRLKSADQRSIAAPTDESIVASPVDATPQGEWSVDANSRLTERSGIPVKTGTVRSVEELIGEASRYNGAFAGGTFTHMWLDVGDYHRYHFPLGGVLREVSVLSGHEMAGGTVAWNFTNGRYAFDPSSISYQALETRGLVTLESDRYGLVAMLPIGMSPVSSVNFEPELRVGVRVRKGDMMGHFLFGDSDFVMIFQAGYEFALEPPRNGSQGYSHLLMGEQLGHLRRIPASRQ